jgi:hypothetical protein
MLARAWYDDGGGVLAGAQAWQPAGILQALQLSMMQGGGLPQMQGGQQQLMPGMGQVGGEAAAAEQHAAPDQAQAPAEEGGADSGQTADGLA